MATVWVPNDAHHGYDYTLAEKFGRVKTLTVGDRVNLFDLASVVVAMDPLFEEMTSEDHILVSGRHLFSIVASIIQWRKFRRVRVLLWHAKRMSREGRDGDYVSRELKESDLTRIEEGLARLRAEQQS